MTKTQKLVSVLRRIDKCENFAQVCWVFDTLPEDIKCLLKSNDIPLSIIERVTKYIAKK